MVRLVLPLISIPVVAAPMRRGRHKAFSAKPETGFPVSVVAILLASFPASFLPTVARQPQVREGFLILSKP
jgi:hypothetical protein